MNISHQDWNTIYLHLDKNKKDKKDEKKNFKKGPSNNLDKTDIDSFKNKKISSDISKKILQNRNSKNLTQKQLAQLINVKPSVKNDYESGKAIPNPSILNKLKKIIDI